VSGSMNDLTTAKPLPTIPKAKRDDRTRYHLRKLFQAAPHLHEERYAPLCRTFIRVTYLLERAYDRIAREDLISTETSELRSSLDTIRKLAAEQRACARELGLSPSTSALMTRNAKTLDLGALRAEFSKVDDVEADEE
jgi:hypothetical protein